MSPSWPLAAIVIVSLPIAAQSTGRIAGKVLNSEGNPVANATVSLRRTDANVTRNVKVDKNGVYSQVGLEPYEFEMLVTADGYIQHKEIIKISVGITLDKNVTMVKSSEAAAAGQPAADPMLAKGNEAAEAYNRAIGNFRGKNYAEAMQDLESALVSFRASIEAGGSEDILLGLQKNLALTEKMLALCQYEVGKTSQQDKRKELWTLAEPSLVADFESNPDDAYVAKALADIANLKGDRKAESRYFDAIERIGGPQADVSYNRAVNYYNDNNFADAKIHLKKAIEIDPNLPDSYYLLAICEYSYGNMKEAKTLLEKYLKLDPKGKRADTVKEMLTDPSFK